MKAIVTFAVAAFLVATAASAGPVQASGAPEQNRAVMLYFAKSFGGSGARERQPLAFGLRFQQTSPLDVNRQVSFLDARYSLGGRRQLLMAGLNAFDSSAEGGSSGASGTSSGAMSEQHPGWTAAAIVLAVLGGMCGFELGLCEHDGRPGTSESPGLTDR